MSRSLPLLISITDDIHLACNCTSTVLSFSWVEMFLESIIMRKMNKIIFPVLGNVFSIKKGMAGNYMYNSSRFTVYSMEADNSYIYNLN